MTLPVPRNEEDIEEKGETCTSHMVPGELNREQDRTVGAIPIELDWSSRS